MKDPQILPFTLGALVIMPLVAALCQVIRHLPEIINHILDIP
jgi:hypothetical protein